jgi:hypothetical protein
LCPLVVEPPVVRKIDDFVVTAGEGGASVFGGIFCENFLRATSLVEVLFEPIEDAGNFDLFLVGKKAVEISSSQPREVGHINLRVEFAFPVGEALKRRTTARGAHENRMGAVADQRAQGAMLNVVEGNVPAADFEPLGVEGLRERLDAVRRIVLKDGPHRERVIEIDKRGCFVVARSWSRGRLLELCQILIETLDIGMIFLPFRISNKAVVVDIFH